MATASLRLVSTSPLSLPLHEPLLRGHSVIDCCRGNVLLFCISNPVMPFDTSLPESHFIRGEHTSTHTHTSAFCIRRWRLTATGIMRDRLQMQWCTHPHQTQMHTPGRLSQLTCRVCVRGSLTGPIGLALWQDGLRPSRVSPSLSLSLG